MIQLIAVLVAVVGSLFAAFEDWRTGFVPDMLNYAMIAVGLVLLPIRYPLQDALAYSFIAGLVFAGGVAFYLFGQLGGGDVKWFTALALLLPHTPGINIIGVEQAYAPYPFIISIFFTAAVLSLLFVSLDYARKLVRDRRKINNFGHTALRGLAYVVLLSPLFYVWVILNPNMLAVVIPISVGAFILAFKNEILKRYVIMRKKVSDLNDDDVLALEVISGKTKKALGLGKRKTFLEHELKALKKKAKANGIKSIYVSEHLPKFGPFIFASLVLNIALGDAFMWLLFM